MQYTDPTGNVVAIPVVVVAVLVLAVLSAAILAEPPAVRAARVESTRALFSEGLERLQEISAGFLGIFAVTVGLAIANTHLMSNTDDDAGGEVIPFPNTLGNSNENDPCWKRFERSEDFIYRNIFPDSEANKMLMDALNKLRRCREGEDVRFPGELIGL